MEQVKNLENGKPKKHFNVTLYLLIIPVLLWLVLLIVLPHIDLLISSFQMENDDGVMVFSFGNYLDHFSGQGEHVM